MKRKKNSDRKDTLVSYLKKDYVLFSLLGLVNILSIIYFNKKFNTNLSFIEIIIYFIKHVLGILVVSIIWLFIFSNKKNGIFNDFSVSLKKYKKIVAIFWIVVIIINFFATIYFGPLL